MSRTITVNLIETISHRFEFDTKDIPDDVDLDDAQEVLEWAEEKGLVDYSNGESIGNNDLSVSTPYDNVTGLFG